MHEKIIGSWIHSHEEDKDGLMVFRPIGFDFPPTRFRDAFEFLEGGVTSISVLGGNDQPDAALGTWTIEGDQVVKVVIQDDVVQWRIVSIDHDKMILQRTE